jgi:hypothetical protein
MIDSKYLHLYLFEVEHGGFIFSLSLETPSMLIGPCLVPNAPKQ